MFDFSFGKLAIIFTLCLIVLGPEKLPKLAQQLGRLAGQARAMARHFRTQLEQEIAAGELAKQKRELEEAVKSGVDAVTNPIDTVAKTVDDATQQILPFGDPQPNADPALEPGAANGSGHSDYEPTASPSATSPAAVVAEPVANKTQVQ